VTPTGLGESILGTLIREQCYYSSSYEMQPLIDAIVPEDSYFDFAELLGISDK
jgi:hypothetical protein